MELAPDKVCRGGRGANGKEGLVCSSWNVRRMGGGGLDWGVGGRSPPQAIEHFYSFAGDTRSPSLFTPPKQRGMAGAPLCLGYRTFL